MKRASAILIVIFLVGVVALAGCGKPTPKTECTSNAECKTTLPCADSYCSQGQCKTTVKANCCGNAKCDGNETSCTCAKDCGDCGGKLKLTDPGKPKPFNATYLQYQCDAASACTLGYNKSLQKQSEFFNEFTGPGFKMNIYVRYPQPYEAKASNFSVEISAKDVEINLVQLPVRVTEIRILEGSKLIARAPVNMSFSTLGKTVQHDFLMSYSLQKYEEQKSIQVAFDYEYIPLLKEKVPGTTDQYRYAPQPVDRKTYQFSISDRFNVIDPTLTQ